MTICIFHRWEKVGDVQPLECRGCFRTPDRVPVYLMQKYPKGYCPHSVKVCRKCGKFSGYGSHGKLTVIPDSCKDQVEFMRTMGRGER